LFIYLFDQAEADTEWKFARTKLYMDYVTGEATLPVPFNIVPSPKTFLHFLGRLCRACCQQEEQPPLGHPGRVKDIEMFPSNGAVRIGEIRIRIYLPF
jgi:hypothetical protein